MASKAVMLRMPEDSCQAHCHPAGCHESFECEQAHQKWCNVQVLVSPKSAVQQSAGHAAALSCPVQPSAPEPLCRVADWFAQLNNKMDGDLKKIQAVGEVR